MKTTFNPGERVIARTNQQGLQRGKPYHVVAPQTVYEWGRAVPSYRLSTWPNANPKELLVRSGIIHLRPVN